MWRNFVDCFTDLFWRFNIACDLRSLFRQNICTHCVLCESELLVSFVLFCCSVLLLMSRVKQRCLTAAQRHKVRRLHLVIVDLWRPWKINQIQVRSLGALRRLQYSADCTTSLSPQPGKTPLYGRRFVYGHSLDGSDFPCYLLWPVRTPTGSYCLLESQTQQYVDMEHVDHLHPLL